METKTAIKLSAPLRAFLESEGALEAFEAATVRHFKGIPKREFAKITEGFNFAKSPNGRDYWVALMQKASKEIGGTR